MIVPWLGGCDFGVDWLGNCVIKFVLLVAVLLTLVA